MTENFDNKINETEEVLETETEVLETEEKVLESEETLETKEEVFESEENVLETEELEVDDPIIEKTEQEIAEQDLEELEKEIVDEMDETSDIPKWNPDENANPKGKIKDMPKEKKIWVVPAIIGGALIVAAIIVALTLSIINNNEKKKATKEAVISTTDTSSKDASIKLSDGYVLTDVSGVVQEVMPSVVGITSRTIVNNYANNFRNINDIWEYFFGMNGRNGYNSNDFDIYGNPNAEGQEVDSGLGSGTIISKNDKELLILTSYHVVAGCSSLYVTFVDGNAVDGSIKAASEEKDIAIVAVPLSDISEETMSAIKIATLCMTDVNVGEGCIIIGNALGYGMSVTTGIVSALDRELTIEEYTLKLIQTDAAINNGNSGGCMLNAKGEVIGISEAKLIDNAVEGMCYAIPISTNSELIQNLLNGKSEVPVEDEEAQGGYLGIQGKDVDQALAAQYGMPQGIYVAGTVKGSGAEKAGLKEGDIIVSIDKVSVLTMDALKEQLAKHNPDDEVTLLVMRKNNKNYKETEVKVKLTSMLS